MDSFSEVRLKFRIFLRSTIYIILYKPFYVHCDILFKRFPPTPCVTWFPVASDSVLEDVTFVWRNKSSKVSTLKHHERSIGSLKNIKPSKFKFCSFEPRVIMRTSQSSYHHLTKGLWIEDGFHDHKMKKLFATLDEVKS